MSSRNMGKYIVLQSYKFYESTTECVFCKLRNIFFGVEKSNLQTALKTEVDVRRTVCIFQCIFYRRTNLWTLIPSNLSQINNME
jgi:hypothetical protein